MSRCERDDLGIGDKHPSLSKQTNPSAEILDKSDVLAQEHGQVVAVDQEEVRLFAHVDGPLGFVCYVVDGDEHTAGDVRLARDLLSEHHQGRSGQLAAFPLRFEEIRFVVQLEGAVYLFTVNSERRPRV